MAEAPAIVAVDLGAASGRVMVGRVGSDGVELREVNRFPNRPVRVLGRLQWDILALYGGILDGLRAAGREVDRLGSVGIDSWAIDYGLLDSSGAMIGNPAHYRDDRTDGVMARVLAEVPAQEIYAGTGVQFLPFNTLYQLYASVREPAFAAAGTALLIPDLVSYWLTGVQGTELTNASTTQLLDPATGTWATGWPAQLGIPVRLFPPLRRPGAHAGNLLPEVLDETGLTGPVPVVAVGSHDTASAVVAVPAAGPDFAYISCGTWSLVGVELDAPVLTEESWRAGFTNELGVDGTTRYLRNVMGLWLLQECMREWASAGRPVDLAALLREAADVPPFTAVVAVDDPLFLPPGGMLARIAGWCRASGQVAPQTPAETVRCILDSLALAYRSAVRDARRLSGRRVDVVHIVGGGARNELLCQLTADACGLPVVAGPVEAAAYGNVLVQARALGAVSGDLAAMRGLLRGGLPLDRYEPRGAQDAWQAAERRLRDGQSAAGAAG